MTSTALSTHYRARQVPPAAQQPRHAQQQHASAALSALRIAPLRQAAWATPAPRFQKRQRQRCNAAASFTEELVEASEFGYKGEQAFVEQYAMEKRKIGKGAHSSVYLAVDRETGERVAVKVMPKRFGPDGFLESTFACRVRNEVDISTRLGKSLNVCYFHGAYETDKAVHLVLELLSGGQLWDRVMKGEYGERQAARIMAEVLRTVAQCHSKDVILRDVKPHNWVFAAPGDDAPLKAVDFGISVYCPKGEYITQRAGTRSVMAPEVVREHYSHPADVWSAGIVAYLLLTGRLPYPFWEKLYVTKENVTADEMFHQILHAPLDFEAPPWDTLSTAAKEFVQALLDRDEVQRPTAEQALQHRWLMSEREDPDVPLNDSIVQRLQRFGTYGRLKQLALRTVASHIPEDSIILSDLRGLFLELDPADRGVVRFSRLQEELEEGNFNLSSAETQQLLSQMEVTPEGDITFPEFVASLVDWNDVQESSEWDSLVLAAFEEMDVDCSGAISTRSLELLLCGEDGCQAPDDIQAPLREARLDQDSCIRLPEFKQLLSARLLDPLDMFESRLVQSQ
ncbi:hypothetical protein D9Q98_003018 [Chlorella vulgaris]|uniref:Protein kinase domain-containing protein n=1 Tax=Chlorella vulgaris TaxID=3077 RepID=A0A9D4TUI5_CHLVU|nr:hypothetical protein D9Q98_003018 [Chlorella vulgaris]